MKIAQIIRERVSERISKRTSKGLLDVSRSPAHRDAQDDSSNNTNVSTSIYKWRVSRHEEDRI